MTFDREPDLDNANVGMPDSDITIDILFTEASRSVASVLFFRQLNNGSS